MIKLTGVQKLCNALEEEGYHPKPETFRRTYAGYHQKSAGTWIWYLRDERGFEIGSSDTVSELVKFGFEIDTSEFHKELSSKKKVK